MRSSERRGPPTAGARLADAFFGTRRHAESRLEARREHARDHRRGSEEPPRRSRARRRALITNSDARSTTAEGRFGARMPEESRLTSSLETSFDARPTLREMCFGASNRADGRPKGSCELRRSLHAGRGALRRADDSRRASRRAHSRRDRRSSDPGRQRASVHRTRETTRGRVQQAQQRREKGVDALLGAPRHLDATLSRIIICRRFAWLRREQETSIRLWTRAKGMRGSRFVSQR